MGWKKTNLEKGNRHERGYGTQWYKIRKAYIAGSQGLCERCLANGRTVGGKYLDHIVNKANGGTDHADNLQLLCAKCHADKTYKESRQHSKHGCDADGMPLDPDHSWNK